MVNDSAKTIVCYGDSNTWGAVPGDDNARYPRSVRWTGALQNILGEDYEVISEGLCGRTFTAMDAMKQHRTGITHLQSILETHDPVDLLIVMLGTNDVKTTYSLSAEEIAQDLEETVFLSRSKKLEIGQKPKILIVCPPPVREPKSKDLDPRLANGADLFKELPALYEKIALQHECGFIDAGKIVSSSDIDGYHLDDKSHKKLAKAIAEKVKEMKI